METQHLDIVNDRGNQNGGLSKRGLGPKHANRAKFEKGPFRVNVSRLPMVSRCRLTALISPEKASIGPENHL